MPVTGAFDREMFDRAITEFRLREAEAMAADADPAERPQLERLIQDRRSQAEESAQELYRAIVDMGTSNEHAGVLEACRRPRSEALLGFLPQTQRQRIDLYLRVAARWEDSQQKVNRRRLAEARRVLEGLDLELARGLVARVEDQYLDEESRSEKDRLVLDIEARAMELDSIQQSTRHLTGGEEGGKQRQPWWRRWRR